MDLSKLTKKELVNLKNDIENQLIKLTIVETKPSKDVILDLKPYDKIFGIRLSFGPHKLLEPKELFGEVDIIDYCKITEINLRGEESKDFRLSISHPELPFGISITLLKEDYKYEHCLLIMDTNKSGYDGFYTLKPELWKEDLKRLFKLKLNNKEKHYQEELKILENKLNLFLNADKTINQYI